MVNAEHLIEVEVAYAKPEVQVLLPLTVPEGTTAAEAIDSSGVLVRFPEIDLSKSDVGIFSKAAKLDTTRLFLGYLQAKSFQPVI